MSFTDTLEKKQQSLDSAKKLEEAQRQDKINEPERRARVQILLSQAFNDLNELEGKLANAVLTDNCLIVPIPHRREFNFKEVRGYLKDLLSSVAFDVYVEDIKSNKQFNAFKEYAEQNGVAVGAIITYPMFSRRIGVGVHNNVVIEVEKTDQLSLGL